VLGVLKEVYMDELGRYFDEYERIACGIAEQLT